MFRHSSLSNILSVFFILSTLSLFSYASVTRENSELLAKSEQIYSACLKSNTAELKPEEIEMLKNFFSYVRGLPVLAEKNSKEQQSEQVIQIAEKIEQYWNKASPRLHTRFYVALAEYRLRRTILKTTGDAGFENTSAYQDYIAHIDKYFISQETDELDSEIISKLNSTFLKALYDWKIENDLKYSEGDIQEVKELNPHSLEGGFPLPANTLEVQNYAIFSDVKLSLNMISEQMFRLILENKKLSKNQDDLSKNKLKVMAMGVGGFGALLSTVVLAPALVAINPYLGGATAGAIGAAGAHMFSLTTSIYFEAYYSSLELGTPLKCELERQISLYNYLNEIKKSAAVGVAAGAVLTGAAKFSPKTVGILMGSLVFVGQTYDLAKLFIEQVKYRSRYALAMRLSTIEKLNAEDESKREKLVKDLLNLAYKSAKKSAQHGASAAIIGVLSYEYTHAASLYKAVREGAQKTIMEKAAFSADTMPTVVSSVAGAVVAKDELQLEEQIIADAQAFLLEHLSLEDLPNVTDKRGALF